MKKKIVMILLCLSLSVSLLNGCGNTEKRGKQGAAQEQKKEDAVYGEVIGLTQDSITVKVDSTGEEQEITITEDTVIKRQSMGGGMGQKPEGGEPPERPEGQQGTENLEPPERSAGDMPDGQKPDMINVSEEIALSDISEGDTIMVIVEDDGSAAEILIFRREQA